MSSTIQWLRIGGCLGAIGLGLAPNALAFEAWSPAGAQPPFDATAADLTPCPPAAAAAAESCGVSFAETLPTQSLSPVAALPEALALDPETVAPTLDLDPAVIEGSPTLQRWLEKVPDVADEIRYQPSFRTRLRAGYVQFPSSGQISGFGAALEDVFLAPGTGLTASVDYSRSSNGQREDYGGELRYYLLPVGGYVNIAPTVGYRALSTPAYQTDGLDVGLRLLLVPSRGGGGDLALSQRWVAPGSDREVGITSLEIGYAVTRQLRLGTDFQLQNSRFGQDSRFGLSLELLL